MQAERELSRDCAVAHHTRPLLGLIRIRLGDYQSRSRSEQRQVSERKLVRAIMDIRSCDPRIGAVKLWLMLKHTFEGDLYGRDRLIDLKHRYGLMLKRKPRIYTTNSNRRYRKYKNYIKELEIKEAYQLWASDQGTVYAFSTHPQKL